MSIEIVQPFTLVNPATGEQFDLDAPTETLGQFLVDVREFELLVREHKKVVQRELLARMDRQAKWTEHVAGLKLVGSSPAPSDEWDGAELRTTLLELVDAGVLSIEAVDAAVETRVTYHPKKGGVNALRKLGGQVAQVVDQLARPVEKERHVRVSRG